MKKIDPLDYAKNHKKLNNLPRKCLGYQTPHEVVWGACSGVL
jgi:IS30 family transposase